nr:hypothetical protein [Tanacetum cinerariifolium]
LFAGLQADLGGQHLGFGDGDRGTRRSVGIDGLAADLVEHARRFAQQGLGGMQFELEAADVGDHIEVVAGALDVGVDPGAR